MSSISANPSASLISRWSALAAAAIVASLFALVVGVLGASGAVSAQAQADADGDGLEDAFDPLPNDPVGDVDGDGIPDAQEGAGDDDGDGLANYYDNEHAPVNTAEAATAVTSTTVLPATVPPAPAAEVSQDQTPAPVAANFGAPPDAAALVEPADPLGGFSMSTALAVVAALGACFVLYRGFPFLAADLGGRLSLGRSHAASHVGFSQHQSLPVASTATSPVSLGTWEPQPDSWRSIPIAADFDRRLDRSRRSAYEAVAMRLNNSYPAGSYQEAQQPYVPRVEQDHYATPLIVEPLPEAASLALGDDPWWFDSRTESTRRYS